MNIAIIFAGGVGARMRTRDIPKQFLIIHGEPVIVKTVKAFERHQDIDHIVVVCVAEWMDACRKMLEDAGCRKVSQVVPGGATGQESIYHGLRAASRIAAGTAAIVLIHDGVRPLIDDATITSNIESVRMYGSAITCIPAQETVITVAEDNRAVKQVIDRSVCQLARAPQSFWLDDLLAAHEWARNERNASYIDSASLMIDAGYELHVVAGRRENIKVTTPEDFYSVQAILDAHESAQLGGD